jgi:hypothetical protein
LTARNKLKLYKGSKKTMAIEKEGYQPTEEEIKKAEEMMTSAQREASEGREESLKGKEKEMRGLSRIEQERIEKVAEELRDKLAKEAERKYSPLGSKYANWGGAYRPRILDTAKGKIIAIPVYKNRDHGVDASVTNIHFFDSEGNPLKNVESKYKRTAANFYEIYPTFKKEDREGKEIIKIEYIQSKYEGFNLGTGASYSRKAVGEEDVEL